MIGCNLGCISQKVGSGMQSIPSADDVDRRPWAAYVVARHVQTLRHWQEERWGEIVWGENCTDEEDRDRFFTELQELRKALRILALADQVKPAVHEELHRSLDQIELLYQNMDETPEQFDHNFSW